MVRVLHVAQPVDGGVAAYVRNLARDQAGRGWAAQVACPDGELAEAVSDDGLGRLRWPAVRSPAAGLRRERAVLRELLRTSRPDLVHLHSSKAGLVGRMLLRGGMPTLFQPHGWSWLAVSGPTATAARLWERRAAGWADRLVCVSAAERDMGRAAGVEGTFAVVRTGVDRMRFRSPSQAERATARRACGIEPGPLAVCVGRASRAKGQDLLVGAWPQVRATVPEAQLALVGGGEMLESLRAQAGPGVSVLGPQADVRPWYAAADVVVLPSRWDALSLALLEACAIGSSIVATQVPGVDEVLGAAGAGAIVAAEPAALADAVAQRLRDPELVGRERRVTSEHAARDLDAAVSFDAMAGLVETVLAERLSPRRGPATGPSAAGS